MSETGQFAIPLFALIDESKVDLSQPLPESLGEQLALYLEGQFGIKSLSSRLLLFKEDPFLVLHDVPGECLPQFCSLVDVKRTQLFRYERTDESTVTLVPLNVKID